MVTQQKLNKGLDLLLSNEKPLTFKEASEYLGISKSHLYKLCGKNLISHYKPNGKLIYFKKKDLDNYIFQNRKEAISENLFPIPQVSE